MTDKPTDRELDDYLAGRSRLSARYREASRETPPPDLDAAILAQARDAARTRPPPRLSWQQRWAVPVGLAATLLLGVDLAWRVSDRVRGDEAALRQESAVRLDEASVAAAAPTVSPPPVPDETAAVAEAAKRRATAPAEPAPPAAAETAPAVEPQAFVADAPPPPPSPEPADEPSPSSDAGAAASDAGDMGPEEQFALEQRSVERRQAQERVQQYALQAQRRADAPAAAAAKAAPAMEPVPRRDAAAAAAAVEDLVALLRAGDAETLGRRYAATQLTRPALADAAAVLSQGLEPRLREDEDGAWRADFVDAEGRLRCTARLRPTADGWQLVGLATRP